MAPLGSSIWRPSSRSHGLRLSSATSVTALILLLMMMLVLSDVSQVSARFQPSNSDINIGAFNIKQFGDKKTKNTVVMMEIARIVTQFDIIAIQEILDNAHVASLLQGYIRQCNCSEGHSCLYAHEISEPLGYDYDKKGNTMIAHEIDALTTRYKERYGFFYRPDTLQIVKTYQYKGGPFMRPPFAAHVKLKNFNTFPEFLFIVVHVQPTNAVEEINSLQRVYSDFRQRSGIRNVIIGGDLNAGGSYWKEYQNTFLTPQCGFHWLIKSNVNTNIKETYPYDRFVVNAKELWQHIRNESADVYKYAVSGNVQLLQISDHYPIGMLLAVGNRFRRSPPTCPPQSPAARTPEYPVQSRQFRSLSRPTKRLLDEA